MNIGRTDFKQLIEPQDFKQKSRGGFGDIKPDDGFQKILSSSKNDNRSSEKALVSSGSNSKQNYRSEQKNNQKPSDANDSKQKPQANDNESRFGRSVESNQKSEVRSFKPQQSTQKVESKNLSEVGEDIQEIDSNIDDIGINDESNVALASGKIEAPVVSSEIRSEIKDESEQEVIPEEQYAMVKFLVAMKTELNVEPEKIVEAMASLDTESLEKTASDTSHDVIEKLDLSPQQKVRAEELYENMLRESAEARMSHLLQKQNQQLDMKVVGPDQIREQKLLASIDSMNKTFFPNKQMSKPDVSPIKGEPRVEQNISGPIAGQNLKEKKSDSNDAAVFAPVTGAGALSGSASGSTKAAAKAYGFKSSSLPSMPSEQSAAFADKLNLGSDSFARNFTPEMSDAASVQALKSTEMSDLTTSTLTNNAAPVEAAAVFQSGDGSGFEGFAQNSSKDGESSDNQDTSVQGLVDRSSQKTSIKDQSPVVFGSNAKPVDMTVNMRQVIQSAQVLIQKGGGEMKVQLRPEGMGNVDLKVSVHNGKVDIQMMTESAEAKRILESGLDDLRTNLGQHKLSLDVVKVDTAAKSSSDFTSGMMNQDREGARDFLNQFRDYNQSQRNNFMDFENKGYSSPMRKHQPEPVQNTNKARANQRRLDLVA